MIYLFLSVLSSSILLIFFKLFEKYNVNTLKARSLNYFFASLLAAVFIPNKISIISPQNFNFEIIFPLILGSLFFLVFNFCNLSTRSAGIGMTSVAMKLALIFPILIGIFIYKENTNWIQILGIFFALVALILLTYQKEVNKSTIDYRKYIVLLVWIGSGVCDSLLQFINVKYFYLIESGIFTFFTFLSAFLISLFYLLIINDLKYDIKSFSGGFFLGIPNYFSIYFLLKTLEVLSKEFKLTSASIFTLNNILIIMFSIIIGLIIFKEKISFQKIIGFIIALLSIILITL